MQFPSVFRSRGTCLPLIKLSPILAQTSVQIRELATFSQPQTMLRPRSNGLPLFPPSLQAAFWSFVTMTPLLVSIRTELKRQLVNRFDGVLHVGGPSENIGFK